VPALTASMLLHTHAGNEWGRGLARAALLLR